MGRGGVWVYCTLRSKGLLLCFVLVGVRPKMVTMVAETFFNFIFLAEGKQATTRAALRGSPGEERARSILTKSSWVEESRYRNSNFALVSGQQPRVFGITTTKYEMDDHMSPGEELGLSTVQTAATEEPRIQEYPGTRPSRAGEEDSQRHQEAHAAFLANSELTAATPRQSIWTGGKPLAKDELDLPAAFPTHIPDDIENQSQEGERAGIKDKDDSDWRPSLSIGSINTNRLSAREAARRYMLQWDHIWEYNRIHNPGSLDIVEENRTEARKEYEEICARNNAEDSVPKHELREFQQERIEARVAVLRQTLAEAQADPDPEGTEPMRMNIAAVLDGYASGALGFSDTYVLIYAGQIVDTSCTSYAEFTVDRQDRLDRYLMQYGPGYLWWEPPLAKAKDRISAKKGTALELKREDDLLYHQLAGGAKFRDDSCHFQISLGFRKDNSLRCRKQQAGTKRPKRKWVFVQDVDSQQPSTKKRARHRNVKTTPAPGVESAEGKRVKVLTPPTRTANSPPSASIAQEDLDAGPTIFLDMLLDSGAEVPILLHSDFGLLGYTKEDMNAATVVELNAAAGQNSIALCFELLVGLDLHEPGEKTTDDDADNNNESQHQGRRHFFPTRVVKLNPSIKPPVSGGYTGERLSGILPFLAYYVSGAPGQDELWIGDERADVLGTQKMPAGLRYDPFRKVAMAPQIREWLEQTGPPARLRKVTFEHDVPGGRKLVDRDIVSRGSSEARTKLTLVDANRKVAASWEMEPAHRGTGRWKRVEDS